MATENIFRFFSNHCFVAYRSKVARIVDEMGLYLKNPFASMPKHVGQLWYNAKMAIQLLEELRPRSTTSEPLVTLGL
jgi:hypothetical protein